MSEPNRKALGPKPEGTSVETGNPDTDGRIRLLLGKAIRVRREKAELTMPAAAELLGVSERTLREWEKGQGSLWVGGPGRTLDHAMMERLRVSYGVVSIAVMMEGPLRNQYPSAPLDPAARREFFAVRNAKIAGFDPDAAVEAMHRAVNDRMDARQRGGDEK